MAIARALVSNPSIILADEPTGNLDSRSSADIIAILVGLNREEGITVVLVTHEQEMAAHVQRIISLRDGQLVDERGMTQSKAKDSAPSQEAGQ